jgi:hypothetical protein
MHDAMHGVNTNTMNSTIKPTFLSSGPSYRSKYLTNRIVLAIVKNDDAIAMQRQTLFTVHSIFRFLSKKQKTELVFFTNGALLLKKKTTRKTTVRGKKKEAARDGQAPADPQSSQGHAEGLRRQEEGIVQAQIRIP